MKSLSVKNTLNGLILKGLSVFFLLSFSISLIAQNEPFIYTSYEDFDPSIKLSKEQLLKDLDYYTSILYNVHGNPFKNIKKSEYLEELKTVKAEVKQLNNDSIDLINCFYYIQFMSALIADSHTKIVWPDKWDKYISSVFPLLFSYVNDTLIVKANMGENGIPESATVISINGYPIKDIKKVTIDYVSATLDHYRDYVWADNLWYFLETTLNLESPWEIKYEFEGKVEEKVIHGISWQARGDKYPSVNSEYSVKSIQVGREKIPVLQLPSFGYGSFEAYKEFLERVFKKWHTHQYMIIDIRENSGGEDVWVHHLLDYFADSSYQAFYSFQSKISSEYLEVVNFYLRSYYKSLNIPEEEWDQEPYMNTPYEYFFEHALNAELNTHAQLRAKIHFPHSSKFKFKGKVFLLTSNKTYSAGVVFSALFQNLSIGTIVGAETGGSISFCSDQITMELPNTHLKARIPVAHLNMRPQSLKSGVIPDVIVKHSVKDYLSRMDQDLFTIKEIIKKDILEN